MKSQLKLNLKSIHSCLSSMKVKSLRKLFERKFINPVMILIYFSINAKVSLESLYK